MSAYWDAPYANSLLVYHVFSYYSNTCRNDKIFYKILSEFETSPAFSPSNDLLEDEERGGSLQSEVLHIERLEILHTCLYKYMKRNKKLIY
ncbi:hypothetical protein B14911_04449 [Bacillus sp. NRRL B-14911]|nr:hypothetical protein B14911_04449 [Bacillus sp. NRRL B-14911]